MKKKNYKYYSKKNYNHGEILLLLEREGPIKKIEDHW